LSVLQDPIFRPLSHSFVCRRRTCNQARNRRGLTKLNPVIYHHYPDSNHSHRNSHPDALPTYHFETTLQ
ncbi:hypothetical protein K439DRAFT_1636016, partial [Ramaria rubella]